MIDNFVITYCKWHCVILHVSEKQRIKISVPSSLLCISFLVRTQESKWHPKNHPGSYINAQTIPKYGCNFCNDAWHPCPSGCPRHTWLSVKAIMATHAVSDCLKLPSYHRPLCWVDRNEGQALRHSSLDNGRPWNPDWLTTTHWHSHQGLLL